MLGIAFGCFAGERFLLIVEPGEQLLVPVGSLIVQHDLRVERQQAGLRDGQRVDLDERRVGPFEGSPERVDELAEVARVSTAYALSDVSYLVVRRPGQRVQREEQPETLGRDARRVD